VFIVAGLKAFGLYFAKLRETSGYRSQRELAEKSGVSHSTINRIEAGTHKANPETLRALSAHLKNVTYEELLTEAGIVDLSKNHLLSEVFGQIKSIEELDEIYALEREFNEKNLWSNDLNVGLTLIKLRKLAEEKQLDLRDPDTFEMFKKAIEVVALAQNKK
jgi:transcriptional regulator with XRE-family HTH domain